MSWTKSIIVDLLNHLIGDQRDLSWKMGLPFQNEVDRSSYEILIYEIKSNETVGRIAFYSDSGRLIYSKVMGYPQLMADNIVDALLDLNNYLKSKLF